MKRKYSFLGLAFLCMSFLGCPDKDNDKTKIVEVTIYPETGYGTPWLSDIVIDALVFSDTDDNQKQLLVDIITEGFDFDYERGYEYTFKAKKVWMSNPPLDVSSIKYQFIGPLRKKKVITEDSEEEMVVFVSSELVKYAPKFSTKDEDEGPEVYDALHVKDTNSNNWLVLKEIEGFDYEHGFEYTLRVKKIIQATPYWVRYVLLETQKITSL